ncbi:MAG: Alcohol dehydrogenase GroES domain protein [Bacteroidetes bacterium]|nr:Alcohol dehydrogenase GroES domain protein [Bacteroidota bacterium]
MKSVSILTSANAEFDNITVNGSFQLENTEIRVGLVEEPNLKLSDSTDPDNRVLIKKRAFSCNYRDKSLIFKYKKQIEDAAKTGNYMFSYFGSEFVGEVIEIGKNVQDFQVGDRVIPNISYPYDDENEHYKAGLPSNHASRRIDDFYPSKLIKISDKIPDEVAAVLPIAGFTSYSMIRKVVKPKAKILVTAAKSNTSLAVISALQNYDVDVYAMTSSPKFSDVLKKMGVKEILTVNLELNSFLDDEDISALMKKIGGFDAVIDPFYDVYLPRITGLMNFDAKYTTCGFYDQYPPFSKKPFIYKGDSLKEMFINIMSKNISIIGNCIGLREDGLKAIKDYEDKKFNIIIDNVFSEGEEKAFLDLTYNFKNRLGKVVYKYND